MFKKLSKDMEDIKNIQYLVSCLKINSWTTDRAGGGGTNWAGYDN